MSIFLAGLATLAFAQTNDPPPPSEDNCIPGIICTDWVLLPENARQPGETVDQWYERLMEEWRRRNEVTVPV